MQSVQPSNRNVAGPRPVCRATPQVLVAGGYTGIDHRLASAEVYDPVAASWTATGSMGKSRAIHAATLLSDGTVLVTGGITDTYSLGASCEVSDPGTGLWTATGDMITPRGEYHSATLLTDGRVLVVGGFTSGAAELYDAGIGS